MALELSEIVPWGRSFDEYEAMFDLGELELAGRILGCGDGPASFNAEVNDAGGRIVSVDPLYRFGASQIAARVEATYSAIVEQVRRDADRFVWDRFSDADDLGNYRLRVLKRFLADYPVGRREGRYVDAALPDLPFEDGEYDLALSSHFLMIYADHMSIEDHLAAIDEMLRVAHEVRIYPLLDLGGSPSKHLNPVIAAMRARNCLVDVATVPYEFLRGGDQMLRLRRP